MKSDWKILGIQIISLIITQVTFIIATTQGHTHWSTVWATFIPSLFFLSPIIIVGMAINLALALLMILIFHNEAKTHTTKATTQTTVFSLSLIPLILMMSWLLSILLPQLVYLAYDQSSWKNNKNNQPPQTSPPTHRYR